MREYQAGGSVSRDKAREKWRAYVYYRDVATDGTKGPWKRATKLLPVRCYPDKDGKPNMRGQKAAQAAMLEWHAELEAQEPERAHTEALEKAGELTARSTVTEHVTRYIDTLEAAKAIEPSTAGTYRRYAEQIDRGANPKRYEPTPGLGAIPLADLTQERVQAWVNGLARTYDTASVSNAARLLRSVCEEKVDEGLISRNPARGVKVASWSREEPNTMAPADLARLMADLDRPMGNWNPAAAVGIKIAIHTGMRRAEISGLRWKNVDLDAGVIKVREVVGIDGDGKTYLKVPKTKKSRRDIPMTAALAADLAAWRGTVADKCRAAGENMRGELFVCGDVDGRYLDPRLLWRAYTRRIKRLGIVGTQGTPPRLHDLRHTFATMAITGGADVKSVSSLLGHASATMTLDVYASATEAANRLAMERVANAIRQAGDAGTGAEVDSD